MNFRKVLPIDIFNCLRFNNNDRDYGKYLEDTNEAIDLLEEDLRNQPDLDTNEVKSWFLNKLKMKEVQDTNSLYRAFLCLENDEIFNLRISDHYSTIYSTTNAWDRYGTPDIETHVIIERIPTGRDGVIDLDVLLRRKPVLVRIYTLSEFNNRKKRNSMIDEITSTLNYGTKGILVNRLRIIESKKHKKKTMSLLEVYGKYKSIIKEILK